MSLAALTACNRVGHLARYIQTDWSRNVSGVDTHILRGHQRASRCDICARFATTNTVGYLRETVPSAHCTGYLRETRTAALCTEYLRETRTAALCTGFLRETLSTALCTAYFGRLYLC